MRVRGGYSYNVTKNIYYILRARGILICEKCGEKFKIGDKVFSKICRNGRKVYHLKCYRELFFG